MGGVVLQLGPLVAVADVLGGEGMQVELLLDADEIGLGELADVHPQEAVARLDEGRDLVGFDVSGLPVPPVRPYRDHPRDRTRRCRSPSGRLAEPWNRPSSSSWR